MCFVSLQFPALQLRQGSTLIAQKGALGIIGAFKASVIMIKIKNRTISTLYYFCNTNQNIQKHLLILMLLFSVLLHCFCQKKIKNAHYIVLLSGCAS